MFGYRFIDDGEESHPSPVISQPVSTHRKERLSISTSYNVLSILRFVHSAFTRWRHRSSAFQDGQSAAGHSQCTASISNISAAIADSCERETNVPIAGRRQSTMLTVRSCDAVAEQTRMSPIENSQSARISHLSHLRLSAALAGPSSEATSRGEQK